ncbi:MAG: FMN-binding protein [Clostridium baratii]|uniref:FMN-binding protein n=1 Tax=Clostridium baratii TaxID=1561 RepID=UPI0006C217AD|nr:FMN-binding protein [Clostridium baratii]MBS6007553.1 FMN-binding protein [Clostridium baratii]MDU1054329.1 FMN-binding protein [Clostridium baratii]MDU4912499.1 FMN-binding protein [Clostridium baratii]CUP62835.1 lipoprotein [Clostridium baratii]
MKRRLVAILCTAVLSLSLVACGSGEEKKDTAKEGTTTSTELKDGTYEAETKEADENGGTAKVKVVVKDGKITEANYNEMTKDGNKRENESYNKMMKEKAGTSPSEYEVEIEKKVVEKQSADFDAVSGATTSSNKAKQLFNAALDNAKEGKTEKASVEIKEAK